MAAQIEQKSRFDLDDGRHFHNPFLNSANLSTEELETIRRDARAFLFSMLPQVTHAYSRPLKDSSIYTGHSGVAWLLLRCDSLSEESKSFIFPHPGEKLLTRALQHVSVRLNPKKGEGTLYCGRTGQFVLHTIIQQQLGDAGPAQASLNALLSVCRQWLDSATLGQEELLFGRVGYLAALLQLDKHLGLKSVELDASHKLVDMVIEAGRTWRHAQSPLMYAWDESAYLGGAHGITGILQILLHIPYAADKHKADIQGTIDFLLSQRCPSGNLPPKVGEQDDDRLVQFCHGAPSLVMLLAQANLVYGRDDYWQAALEAAEVVWHRGLLAKGLGLCHGIFGNAYAFLTLYRRSGDEMHLHRAARFVQFGLDPNHLAQYRQADRPYSLMEGVAGACYFLCDFLEPQRAAFPGFEF